MVAGWVRRKVKNSDKWVRRWLEVNRHVLYSYQACPTDTPSARVMNMRETAPEGRLFETRRGPGLIRGANVAAASRRRDCSAAPPGGRCVLTRNRTGVASRASTPPAARYAVASVDFGGCAQA
mmetsp:Transcript_27823/g.83461  ORF Transcript_27823/g.83461 Transcript_27823/m.83461 type:complete len:123 (-) Transcript_27823:882-1250(-)